MNQSEQKFPLCEVFGSCGGCQYQHLTYLEELLLKEQYLRDLFAEVTGSAPGALSAAGDSAHGQDIFEKIVDSPKLYHYRSRMDMKFLRTKSGDMFMGFTPAKSGYLIEVDKCPIAMEPISDFLPELKRLATEKIPPAGRNANLVVKTGDDGRVFWGGIGKRSLRQAEADYLFCEVRGKRIFYSLETFFQANLSILPKFFDALESLFPFDKQTVLWDLYSGVGLFGIVLADKVKQVIMIEENVHSVNLAKHNAEFHKLDNCEILSGFFESHEERLKQLRNGARDGDGQKHVAIIDPPRNGLSAHARELLSPLKKLDSLFYLSCQPEALLRDIKYFQGQGWEVTKIIPFDFFPRTRHIETLAVLRPVA